MRAALALARFHARTGASLALRAAVPIGGVLAAAIGMSPNPGAEISHIAASLARGEPAAAAVTLLLSLLVAGWAATRLTRDGAGWMRHLPADATARRLGVVAGLAWAQVPIVCALAAAAISQGAVPRALGAPVAAVAVGFGVAPLGRRWAVHPPALLAAWLALTGGVASLAGACVLVFLSDRLAGPSIRSTVSRPRRPMASRLFFPQLAWRALGGGVLLELAPALLPVGAAALYVANNDLPAALESRAVRLGALLGATFATAAVAERLATRRPPWAWERSLPRSSRERALADARVLALAAVFPVVASAPLGVLDAIVVLAFVPFLACRGASAMRRQGASRTLAAGPILIEGSLAALAASLMPWLSPVALAAAVWAAGLAERAERERSAVRWVPLHHDVRGDAASWSGR